MKSPREIRDEDIDVVMEGVKTNPSSTADGMYICLMLSLICKSIRDLKGPMD